VAYRGEVDEHGPMALPPADGTRAYQEPLYEASEVPQWVEAHGLSPSAAARPAQGYRVAQIPDTVDAPGSAGGSSME